MIKKGSWLKSGFHSGNFFFYGLLSIVFSLAQIIFLPCSFAQNSSIQNTENNFRAIHWGVEEGMSQGVVDDMIKDVNGFLWIGTQHGLNRFDGSNFKKYFADKTKRNKAISGNNIGGLIEDSLHNIWIGTDKGVSIYDIKEDTFRNLFSVPVTSSYGSNVIPFWATKDEVFCWDYPESQLAAYDIHTYLKRTLAKISTADSVGNGISDHYPVFDGGSNSIWLEKGFRGPNCGLLQISLTTGEKKEFIWSCYKKIPNHSHSFEGMRYDRRRNSIWINNPDGLLEFTLDDRQFHPIDALNEFDKRKDFWLWAGISIDRLGRIWIGTSDGIIIYDPAKHSIRLPFPNDSLLQRNITDANVLVYCDRDGIGWSGSWSAKGIYQVIPFSHAVVHYISDPKRSNSLSDDFTHDCMDDGKGRIWINAGDVIDIFDTNTGFFRQLLKKDLKGTTGERKEVAVAFIDTINQKAYINTDGLYRMDMATNQCVRVKFKDSNNQIIPLLSGGFPTPYQNTCIFTTYFNGQEGIFILEEDSAVVRQLLSFPAGSYFPAGTIDFFRTATDDNLIFLRQPDSTNNLTYSPRNGKFVRTPNPFDSIRWTRLIYNKADRTYWLAAENTLLHYDGNFRLIRNYTLSDGLPDAEIFGMIPDKFNNIWLNTESAIFQLNIKSGRISSLSEKDGFKRQGFSYFFNFMKSTSGELYLTGGVFGQGFNRISPSRYIYTSSSVYLQSLLVNQKPFLFSTGVNNLKELFLNYSENNITIETGIIDFYSRGNSHIRYKLGEKADWLYPVNSAVYTIHYEDLLPGDYELIMQASNASNEFEGPEKTLLFHISPPWWQTWWARVLFILAFIFSLWSFILYRSRNLKKRNAALEVKVLDRTKELKHSLEELRDTQTQLIQREKMASLGELTAGIAHEIQNPLNFVNNFSDLNRELLLEMKDEMDKGNIPTAREIANDVMDNEDKINHHGKRADAIVKSMLQHSRSSAGQKEPSDINALADEYLRLSYHGLRSRDKMFHATIQTDFDETLEKINVIPQDIGRVLLNLFNNAFYSINEKKKLSGEGFEPVILVSTKKITNKAEIKVRDNGLGIPQKVLEKVYQPFFTTKAPGEGTGLGLSLSYDIITKIHGGELKVETEEGEFAEFTVILPI